MSRGRAWLRYQRERNIKKRFHIQYDCWRHGHEHPGPHKRLYTDPNYIDDRATLLERSRKLAKFNLVCSCGLCTGGKRANKRNLRHVVRLLLKKVSSSQ